MKLYKIRNPDCIYCSHYKNCLMINKFRDCFSINPDLVLTKDLVLKVLDGNVDIYNDFIKFLAECEVIYNEG